MESDKRELVLLRKLLNKRLKSRHGFSDLFTEDHKRGSEPGLRISFLVACVRRHIFAAMVVHKPYDSANLADQGIHLHRFCHQLICEVSEFS